MAVTVVKKRIYKRKNRVAHLRPATKLAINRLVKGKFETKRQYYNLADRSLYGSQIYAMDLTQYISQGTSNVQRVGETITDVYARVSATWSWSGLGSTNIEWTGGSVRLMLVKTTVPITGVSINTLTDVTGQVSPMFLNSAQSINSYINDTQPIKVIAQKYLKSEFGFGISPYPRGTTSIGFMSHKLCAKQTYLAGTGDRLGKTWNYYLVATSSAPSAGSSANLGFLQCSAVVTYKDA